MVVGLVRVQLRLVLVLVLVLMWVRVLLRVRGRGLVPTALVLAARFCQRVVLPRLVARPARVARVAHAGVAYRARVRRPTRQACAVARDGVANGVTGLAGAVGRRRAASRRPCPDVLARRRARLHLDVCLAAAAGSRVRGWLAHGTRRSAERTARELWRTCVGWRCGRLSTATGPEQGVCQ